MSNTVGSKFYKIDFHVHTPCSSDYKDKSAKPEKLVDAAINAGLDAILPNKRLGTKRNYQRFPMHSLS